VKILCGAAIKLLLEIVVHKQVRVKNYATGGLTLGKKSCKL
jgi:hypothetical protein